MFVTFKELEKSYWEAEHEKDDPSGFLKDLIIASGAYKQTMFAADLKELRICIEPKKYCGERHPTYEIFELLDTDRAGKVAKNIAYLNRNGSHALREWLKTIDERLKLRILEGSCPPIIVSKRTLIHRGNIPDGSHRVLAALSLFEEGHVDVSLEALILKSSSAMVLLLNTLLVIDRAGSSLQNVLKLLALRMK